jgi:hypothetical protein
MTKALLLLALLGLLTQPAARGQSSPARGPIHGTPTTPGINDMPLADYLGLLRQIAPAAEAGDHGLSRRFRAALWPGTHRDRVAPSDVGR